nr:hypothetical protein CFP56_59555 [Quercus suber]
MAINTRGPDNAARELQGRTALLRVDEPSTWGNMAPHLIPACGNQQPGAWQQRLAKHNLWPAVTPLLPEQTYAGCSGGPEPYLHSTAEKTLSDDKLLEAVFRVWNKARAGLCRTTLPNRHLDLCAATDTCTRQLRPNGLKFGVGYL